MERLTRIKAIRKKCIDCSDTLPDVKNCWDKDCPLYPYRMGKRPSNNITPSKAVHLKCLWCMYDQPYEIRKCPSKDCALWVFRLGVEIPLKA